MQNSEIRFAMAIHIIQRSNPATRQALEAKRANNFRRSAQVGGGVRARATASAKAIDIVVSSTAATAMK